jgi:predicted RNase H-like HicB family nuclease
MGLTAYTYHVTYSPEDGEYVGLCTAFPSLSYLHADRDVALAGIEELVTAVLADMRANGELPPQHTP